MREACYCGRCVPTSIETVCSACGQEVRFGTRHGARAYWHREDVDHAAVLGHTMTIAQHEANQRARALYRPDEAVADDDDDAPVAPLPPVEVACHPVDPDSFPPRSGIKQVLNLIEKTEGWERYRLTHARGPYTGAKGQCLSVSDTIVLGARQVLLDGTVRVAVASWRDGKFDFAFIGIIKDHRLSPFKVDASSMKKWIKGTYDLPEPVQ